MPDLSSIGLLTAFAAGIVSFLSPCVLPLVPGYVSYVAGRTVGQRASGGTVAVALPALGLSICFVLGFTTVFVALGASATALGQLLIAYRYELNIAGGVVIILFGLFLIGWVRSSWMQSEARFHASPPSGRAASAYVLGLAFAFGWTPCIGPILGAILTVSASSYTVMDGVALLAIYSMGLGVPFLLAALFTDALTRRLRTLGRVGRSLRFLAGTIMVLMGAAMITGHLSAFAFWLLEAMPGLATIG